MQLKLELGVRYPLPVAVRAWFEAWKARPAVSAPERDWPRFVVDVLRQTA